MVSWVGFGVGVAGVVCVGVWVGCVVVGVVWAGVVGVGEVVACPQPPRIRLKAITTATVIKSNFINFIVSPPIKTYRPILFIR
jgi:hypothetical protein